MRKAKSRNFILIVCGIFITLLLSFVISSTIVDVVDELSNKETNEKIQKNILSSSSKIRLSGTGNFIDSTPKLSRTTISDFNVRLINMGDTVSYSIVFCNMNDSDLRYEDLVKEGITCVDKSGEEDCSVVEIDSYLLKRGKKIEKNSVVSANSCVELVVSAKYISDVSKEFNVYIDKVALELVKGNR